MKKEIFENMKKYNKFLSKYACSDDDAIRFEYLEDDIRTSFFRDIDRIIYSLSYIRILKWKRSAWEALFP